MRPSDPDPIFVLGTDRGAPAPRQAVRWTTRILLRVTDRNRHLSSMARIALLVAVVDWVTKGLATRFIQGDLVLSERLRLTVVHNDAAAFGLSFGTYTWQLNLALTLFAIVVMIPVSRDLARIDRSAPRALGLIMGGAIGNLMSLVFTPKGVVDFISVGFGAGSELVLNVADLAAYAGLVMIARTAFLIVGEIRKTAQPLPVTLVDVPGVRMWRSRGAEAEVALFADREVPVPVFQNDGPGDAPVAITPRPESVRRAERGDAVATDAKVIDIRPRLALQLEQAARPADLRARE